MIALTKHFLHIRIVRYGLVGGVGILVNVGALFCFKQLLGLVIAPQSFALYLVASACSFEVSNLINFTLNQLFTYSEQVQHIRGWEWLRRAGKGQLTSLSALLISYLVGAALVYFLHVLDYLANPIGIVVAFFYNFFISNRLVFRATAPGPVEQTELAPQRNVESETTPDQTLHQVESTPK